MTDVPARIGVPVMRFPDTETGRFTRYHEGVGTAGERGLGVVYEDDPRPNVIEPGLWFASTPEAVAEMRERIARSMKPWMSRDEKADVALRALGFTDA